MNDWYRKVGLRLGFRELPSGPSRRGLPDAAAFFVTNLLGSPKLKLDERFGLLASVDVGAQEDR
jgi:hypothetical protein